MRLFTVSSLYFQVLGIGFSRFQDIANLRIAPMGQFRRSGLNISEINTSRTKRLTVVISAEKEAEKTGKTLE